MTMTMSVATPAGGFLSWRPRNDAPYLPQQVVHVTPVASSPDAFTDAFTPAPQVPAWISDVQTALLRIAVLEPNWDGEHAAPLSPRALHVAITVLAETMSNDTIPPQIVPTYRGGLQLEWHCAGVDLEVYIQPNGQVSAWLQEAGREWEFDRYPRARLSRELSLLTRAYVD